MIINEKYGKGTDKGKHIDNYKKFSQPVLFDGIGKGQCRPTDYDAVLEIDNQYWFGFEVKMLGKGMPYGQSLSYTRNADRWDECSKVGMVFIAEHFTEFDEEPIMLKDCTVLKYYHRGKWKMFNKRVTVLELLSYLKKKYNITKI